MCSAAASAAAAVTAVKSVLWTTNKPPVNQQAVGYTETAKRPFGYVAHTGVGERRSGVIGLGTLYPPLGTEIEAQLVSYNNLAFGRN